MKKPFAFLIPFTAILLLTDVAALQEVRLTKEEWQKAFNQFQTTLSAAQDVPSKVAAVKLLLPSLGRLQDPRWETQVVPPLFKLFEKEKDDAVIDAVIDDLALITNPDALDAMSRAASGVPAHLRVKICALLGKIGYEGFLAPLKDYLTNGDVPTVAEALGALARLSGDEAVVVVVEAMGVRNPAVRDAALEAIKASGDHRFVAGLIGLLKRSKKDDALKNVILEILKAITGQDFGAEPKPWEDWLKANKRNPLAKVNQKAVDDAIAKGAEWLHASGALQGDAALLVAYTTIHAGLPADDARMKAAIALLESAPLTRTYHTAIVAMALHDLDKIKYRKRLAECAYFIMGNQDPKGYWRYGEPVDGFVPPEIPDIETPPGTPPIETGGEKKGDPKKTDAGGKGGKGTETVPKIPIKVPPRRTLVDWDHSNSQYALLGLRACADAGILIPAEVWRDAEQHFTAYQNGDGGWNYRLGQSYGSMSAGGVSSLAICKYYQGKPWKDNGDVLRGIAWLAQNFTVTSNPKFALSQRWHFYYLYGVERAGILAGTETFGTYEWYPIGANWLLANQDRATGSWHGDAKDTCFAILFLRRATEYKPPPEKPKEIETGKNKQ